jgi:hypothetical protein
MRTYRSTFRARDDDQLAAARFCGMMFVRWPDAVRAEGRRSMKSGFSIGRLASLSSCVSCLRFYPKGNSTGELPNQRDPIADARSRTQSWHACGPKAFCVGNENGTVPAGAQPYGDLRQRPSDAAFIWLRRQGFRHSSPDYNFHNPICLASTDTAEYALGVYSTSQTSSMWDECWTATGNWTSHLKAGWRVPIWRARSASSHPRRVIGDAGVPPHDGFGAIER